MKSPFILLSSLAILHGMACAPKSGPMASGRVDTATFASTSASNEEYFKPQNIRYDNFRYEPDLKSVRITPAGEILGPPLMTLGSMESLMLSFDDLTAEYRSLNYTFIHCSADWQPSGLNESEYLEGFHQDFITDYQYSFNTLQRYISYQLLFPNQNMMITKSGNYILLIFDETKEKPVLTRRFMVWESQVRIDARVVRPSINAYRFYKHEVDFTIYSGGLTVQNPFSEIIPVVLQNLRWDNAITNLKPLFVKDNELVYDYDEANNFPGSNEYRSFDMRSLRYTTEFVQDISQDSIYHVKLVPAEPRANKRYSNLDDINGYHTIKNYHGGDDRTESEYALVHFELKVDYPVSDGQVYVFGELSDWTFREECRMVFDPLKSAYTTDIYLKQGYYNYLFMTLPDSSGGGDPVPIEGMHFDTEVPYTVLVYFRSMGGRFDRLVGLTTVSSRM